MHMRTRITNILMTPGVTTEANIPFIYDAEILIERLLDTVEWDYPTFHLTMHCFICTLLSESWHLNEHEASAWLTKENLHSVKWLPADEGLIPKIADGLK